MSDSKVRFLLNGRPVECAPARPSQTLLQYLRQDCQLPGTKEGCAEGDCGACTVTVSDLDARGRVRHRAVNACIQFLPVVHGRAVTTVEGIATPDGPHPVQQAMVDQHASQCGFCTPGFVMSLYAGHREQSPCMISRGDIDRMLSGNLCRCTGYRPIAAAAVQAFATPRGAAETARDAALARDLARLRRAGGELVLDGAGGKWYSPASEAALARCLAAHPEARIIAGLTDVGLWSTKHLRSFDKLVYLGNIASLKQVTTGGGMLSVGAGVTWTDAIPVLTRHWPQMDGFLARFASPPVRNTATVGGNVANGSPIGDSMPAFIALDARVVLRGATGEREMPLEDFYLAYQKTALAAGEYVAGLRIPLPVARRRFRVYKLSKRFDQDISAVCAAFAVDIERGAVRAARIAFGGMAATPKRAAAAEAALIGTTLDDAALAAAQTALDQDYAPIADMRASAAYRQTTAKNLLRRFVLELRNGATPVSLDQLKVIA